MKLICIIVVGAIAQLAGPSSAAEQEEVAPEQHIDCFRGAYYRKAVSSKDKWSGIVGTVRLPQPRFDESRTNPKTGRYLDNPSVYMGGNANEQEIDCGLTWEVIREPDGSVSKQGKAFRSFWRTDKWNSGPARPEFYYYPGDVVRMTCMTSETGKLSLSIEPLERSTTSSTSLTSFSVTFDAREFGPGIVQEFKRVNAIDQSGNEGKPVKPTKTVVEGAKWSDVQLIRDNERRPFTGQRYTDMRCPSTENVSVEPNPEDPTGETITIRGNAVETTATAAVTTATDTGTSI